VTTSVLVVHAGHRDIMRRPHFLTQNVTIVGPGDPNFDAAISALGRVGQLFSQSFPISSFQAVVPRDFWGMQALMANTRYLTPGAQTEFEGADEAVLATMDPSGSLGKWVGGGQYRFTEDNVVAYRCAEMTDAGFVFSLLGVHCLNFACTGLGC
jgi:hypothetical protein